eukprot:scaffold3001_cov189-Ochromonas_danica.AAC.2
MNPKKKSTFLRKPYLNAQHLKVYQVLKLKNQSHPTIKGLADKVKEHGLFSTGTSFKSCYMSLSHAALDVLKTVTPPPHNTSHFPE